MASIDYTAVTDRVAELLKDDPRLEGVYFTTELAPVAADRAPAGIVQMLRVERKASQITGAYPSGSPDEETVYVGIGLWTFNVQGVSATLAERNDVVRRTVAVLRDNLRLGAGAAYAFLTRIDFGTAENETSGSLYGHALITLEVHAWA